MTSIFFRWVVQPPTSIIAVQIKNIWADIFWCRYGADDIFVQIYAKADMDADGQNKNRKNNIKVMKMIKVKKMWFTCQPQDICSKMPFATM